MTYEYFGPAMTLQLHLVLLILLTAIIGTFNLKESLGVMRIMSTALIVAGVIILQVAA